MTRRFLFKSDEVTSVSDVTGNANDSLSAIASNHTDDKKSVRRTVSGGSATGSSTTTTSLLERALMRKRSTIDEKAGENKLDTIDDGPTMSRSDERDTLLGNLKMQVKQVMEEAVTRKFIHEENCSVTSLCAAIEACLLCGVRRQVGSFFRGPSSWDLLCKVSCSGQCAAAQQVHQRVLHEQQQNSLPTLNGRPSAGSDSSSNSPNAPPLSASATSSGGGGFFSASSGSSTLQRFFRDSTSIASEEHPVDTSRATYFATRSRYLWLRIALCEKYLGDIVDYLVKNASKYYLPESVLGDACQGEVFLHLLAGPCALDYTKLKTCDHLWSDPPADELVQRHNLQHGGLYSMSPDSGLGTARRPFSLASQATIEATASTAAGSTSPTDITSSVFSASSVSSTGPDASLIVSPHPRASLLNLGTVTHHNLATFTSPSRISQLHAKPSLVIRPPSGSAAVNEERRQSVGSGSPCAKDYVEALHQNSKSVNIYGKNNVVVQPRENVDRMPGYLGLHSSARGLFVQWIPNQLMSIYATGGGGGGGGVLNTATEGAAVARQQATPSSSSPLNSASGVTDVRRFPSLQEVPHFEGDASFVYRSNEILRRRLFWDYALTINLDEIAYIHCHQEIGTGGSLVFVDVDGVQRPPLHFPQCSSHMLAFLSHLESALAPHGRLDPPLWTQRGKGKVFPKLKRRSTYRKSPRLFDPKEVFSSRAKSCEGTDKTQGLSFFTGALFNLPSSSSDNKSSTETHRTAEGHVDFNINEEDGGAHLGEQVENVDDDDQMEEEEALDFVFRIVIPNQYTHKGISDEPWMDIIMPDEPETRKDNGNGGVSISLTNSGADSTSTSVHRRSQEQHNNRTSIAQLCSSMRKQILARAFYGWLMYSRRIHNIRQHLSDLVYHDRRVEYPADYVENHSQGPVTMAMWKGFMDDEGRVVNPDHIKRHIYLEGCTHAVRKEVWPFLLGVYEWSDTKTIREKKLAEIQRFYEEGLAEWLIVETIVRQREPEEQSSGWSRSLSSPAKTSTAVANSSTSPPETDATGPTSSTSGSKTQTISSSGLAIPESQYPTSASASVSVSNSKESLVSPATSPASNGGVYTAEVQRNVSENMHRIDKDVSRCDRSYEYFYKANRQLGVQMSAVASSMGSGTGNANLDKLRNVMCTYVWQHLHDGYVQGMCDLLAPLLVVVDDEPLAHACFERLMMRMRPNFPSEGDTTAGTNMDQYFAKMRSLVQILDPSLLEHMHRNGDCTNFYFSYRWFLLNFKREMKYENVFWVWETIWTAEELASPHFVVFVALALVLSNRDIIVQNEMDATDIIRFFNERAEKHNAAIILRDARHIVYQLQVLLADR